MEEILKRLIKRFILPKYPNIKDFNVTEVDIKAGIHNYEAKNFYSVHYFVENGENYENDMDIKKKIESDTRNLYKALGTEKYDVFESIHFFDFGNWRMTESLKKLIGNVIPAKYLWIKDFDVLGHEDFGDNLYTILYYVDDNLYKKIDRNEINRLKSDTRNLYTSLGPTEKDSLKEIIFVDGKGEWKN